MRTQLVTPSEVARDLRAVVLLAGRVGSSEFADGIQRSVLDLPIGAGRTLLDAWTDEFAKIARAAGDAGLLVRIALDQAGPAPTLRAQRQGAGLDVEIVRDPADYRGTAGVVKDVTADFGPDDRVLVLNASQIHREPLLDVLEDLGEADEAVSIVPHGTGHIAAAFLLRCGRLANVANVGFVDLKEQAIPASGDCAPLSVRTRHPGSALPLRTRAEYLQALRALHASRRGAPDLDPAFAETWMPSFTVVEERAEVAEGAVIQDAVVLSGARVEAGAIVARSVVCPGGVVRRGELAVDRTVKE